MNSKICFKCCNKKPLSDFYKHCQMKDGHLNKCISCTKKDVSENQTDYDKTEKGVIRVLYKTQKFNSKRRKHPMPSYSKDWLTAWLYLHDFKKLYQDWVLSGYLKNEKPSIDRLDDYKPYTENNIRLVKWKENKEKQNQDIILGRSTSGERCKAILQFDCNNNFIAEYVSVSSAKRINQYNMDKSIISGKTDRRGFKWRYKENDE